MTDTHDHSPETQRDDLDVYEQIQRLFWVAVELPPDKRIAWAKSQRDLDPQITSQLVAALEADEISECQIEVVDRSDPAFAVTARPAASETQRDRTRSLPSIPGYDIVEEIARGGMGVVYRARQHRPVRFVAIKMMKLGAFSSSSDVERFLNEANAASRLNHPAVVPVYEVGELEEEPFITMKFIDGQTLQWLLEHNKITVTDAILKLSIVAQAIADAHAHGIIHRDLKPSNIMIDRSTGQPWVMDFGLAKNLDADLSLTNAGDIMGTPGYMAPEQASGQSCMVTPAADVYGLGAILYQILTGRPPIQSADRDIARTIEMIREHDVVSPRERDRSVPNELNLICVKSLETNSAQRYQHAGEFADDLLRYLQGEAIQAQPLSVIRRLNRWARQSPGLAATVSVLGVFSIYHLIGRSTGLHRDSPSFNNVVMVIIPVALMNAWFWQYWLRRTLGAAWTLYGWSTGEIILISCLIIADDGARSGLMSAYFLLVAASVLRCRPLLIGYVTGLTMLSSAAIWIYTVFTLRLNVDPLFAIPRLLILGLVGMIQYIALRQSSVSFESQVDQSFRSRSRNQK